MSNPRGLTVKILMDGAPIDVTDYAMGGKDFLQSSFSMAFYVTNNIEVKTALDKLGSEVPLHLEIGTNTVKASGLCRSAIREDAAGIIPVAFEWIQRIVEGKPFQPSSSSRSKLTSALFAASRNFFSLSLKDWRRVS